jgi:hypothetical protein
MRMQVELEPAGEGGKLGEGRELGEGEELGEGSCKFAGAVPCYGRLRI